MKLSTFKSALQNGQQLNFELADGTFVPAHYHITEIGSVQKNFIDCGGTVRSERKISFQLWFSNDLDHRLTSGKLQKIIAIGEEKIGLADLEIEVEYQNGTIGKFGLELKNEHFALTNLQTACLAEENCGIPAQKPKLRMAEIQTTNSGCTPGGGCC